MSYDAWKTRSPDDEPNMQQAPEPGQEWPANIVTCFVYPPIPVRSFDWQAHYDGDEPNDAGGMAVGYGATEAEAVHDLMDNYPRDEE